MGLGICDKICLQKVLFNFDKDYDMTKHVEIDRHLIKEKLDNGNIYIPYIPSSQEVAKIVEVLKKGLFSYRASSLVLISWVFLTSTTQLNLRRVLELASGCMLKIEKLFKMLLELSFIILIRLLPIN